MVKIARAVPVAAQGLDPLDGSVLPRHTNTHLDFHQYAHQYAR
jgi:hypothetical protein